MNNEENSNEDNRSQIEKKVDLNFQHLKLIDFFLENEVNSYQIVEADSNYYKYSLDERKQILGAHSIDVLCKTIILENTSFDEKYQSKYYNRFYMAIVQYTNEFNAEKIAKILKGIQNANCEEKLSNKYFHFRLAKNEVAYDMTGYKFNCITPYLMKTNLQILFPKNLMSIYPQYFWAGGGELELKVGLSIEDFLKLYSERTFVIDLSTK